MENNDGRRDAGRLAVGQLEADVHEPVGCDQFGRLREAHGVLIALDAVQLHGDEPVDVPGGKARIAVGQGGVVPLPVDDEEFLVVAAVPLYLELGAHAYLEKGNAARDLARLLRQLCLEPTA